MRETVWQFETARYRVALEISPEDMNPADSFDDPEDIEAINSGKVEWFQTLVVVYLKQSADSNRVGEIELGWDSLCGCAYNSVREFYTLHRDPDPLNRNSSLMRAKRGDNTVICHYFPSMVAEAIADARRNINQGEASKCLNLF